MSFPPLFMGSLTETVGTAALTWALYNGHEPTIFGMMALVGVGIGMRFMVSPLHGIGIFKQHRATIIGLMAVAVPLGGTIGLTVMSALFNNTSGLDAKHSDFSKLHDLTPELRASALHNVKMGVVWAYVGIVPFMALVCVQSIVDAELANNELAGVFLHSVSRKCYVLRIWRRFERRLFHL